MFDTDEEKAALQAAVDDAVKAANAALTAEFIKEKADINREAAKWRRQAQGKDVIDPAEVERLEGQIDKLTDELNTAKASLKDAGKKLETAVAALESETGYTQKLLIDNGLVKALTDNGVNEPVHIKAAQAMLRGDVKVLIDGEKRSAVVGEKPLADYVKEWAAGDEGKHFVTAPINSGGGATAGKANLTPEQIKGLSPEEKMNQGRK